MSIKLSCNLLSQCTVEEAIRRLRRGSGSITPSGMLVFLISPSRYSPLCVLLRIEVMILLRQARPRNKKKGRGPPRVPVPSSPPKKDRFEDDEKVTIEIDESLYSG